jgi:hypothetical protein
MRTKLALLATTVGAAAIAALLAASPAAAKGRPLGRPVKTSGICTDQTSTFTLKSMFDDEPFAQTVGAEFEVDTGVVGQSWQVTLTDNGIVFFDALVGTTGPEGALNVTHPDQGAFNISHTIVARAVNRDNGAVCTGQVIDLPIR